MGRCGRAEASRSTLGSHNSRKLRVVRCWPRGVFIGVIFASLKHLSEHTNDTASHDSVTRHSYGEHCVICPFRRGGSVIPSTCCPTMTSSRWNPRVVAQLYEPLGAPRLIKASRRIWLCPGNQFISHLIYPLRFLPRLP